MIKPIRVGAAVSLLPIILSLLSLSAQGAIFETLHVFNGADGGGVYGAMVQGQDGYLYGAGGGGDFNAGSIFRIAPNGSGFQMLFSFPYNSGNGTYPKGASPEGGLVERGSGVFYGTTSEGALGAGTVFKVTTNGTLTTVYSFSSATYTNGTNPRAGLVKAQDGNLYGTTPSGGPDFKGVIFRITTNDVFERVSIFSGTNGATPWGTLICGTDGNLYGTTSAGGDNYGTIFRCTTNGVLTTLHTFDFLNGNSCRGALVEGDNGVLYGTSFGGGNTGNDYGTVFAFAPGTAASNSTIASLKSFDVLNGNNPHAGLARKENGFYGTTVYGGYDGTSLAEGTIFAIGTNGVMTTLYYFRNAVGSHPHAGMVLGLDGNLYGTTTESLGGAGIIFRLRFPVAKLTQPTVTNQLFQCVATGLETNEVYSFETSSNLVNWTTLTNFTDVSGSLPLSDSNSQSEAHRFYRIGQFP